MTLEEPGCRGKRERREKQQHIPRGMRSGPDPVPVPPQPRPEARPGLIPAGPGQEPEREPARRYSRAQDEPPQAERGAEAAPQPLGLHGGHGAKSGRAAPSAPTGPAAGGARAGPAPPVWGQRWCESRPGATTVPCH